MRSKLIRLNPCQVNKENTHHLPVKINKKRKNPNSYLLMTKLLNKSKTPFLRKKILFLNHLVILFKLNSILITLPNLNICNNSSYILILYWQFTYLIFNLNNNLPKITKLAFICPSLLYFYYSALICFYFPLIIHNLKQQ